ncbi:MAG: 4-alpha-glucanotransferase [Acidobacteriota bacterium]
MPQTAKPTGCEFPLDRRRAGILLHPTSLPSGTLGKDAYRFLDFLDHAGLRVWQVLPMGPTHEDGSPYLALSAMAGDPGFIDLDILREQGWLNDDEYPDHIHALHAARAGFIANADEAHRAAYRAFLDANAEWLDDYVLFMALRQEQGNRPWWEWLPELREREPRALKQARKRLSEVMEQLRFEQFLFSSQWHALKAEANARGILLFGDMPIFVSHDSAAVWTVPEVFDLDEHGHARHVAGVPPDYFSATGQRWGNPIFDWEAMRKDDFAWWKRRMGKMLELYDFIRVDHFRGFEAFWSIPAEEETAMGGHWVKAPGKELFEEFEKVFGRLPVVAEDLGIITPEVEALRDAFHLPGMKILQFAFDGSPDNPYLPAHHTPNSVVYTGTHDNDTTLGWFQSLGEGTRQNVLQTLHCRAEDMPWALIEVSMQSPACLAVVPLQDFLALDGTHRLNTPGTNNGSNWRWKFDWSQFPADLAERICKLLAATQRV